jgi:hypothetical protein
MKLGFNGYAISEPQRELNHSWRRNAHRNRTREQQSPIRQEKAYVEVSDLSMPRLVSQLTNRGTSLSRRRRVTARDER